MLSPEGRHKAGPYVRMFSLRDLRVSVVRPRLKEAGLEAGATKERRCESRAEARSRL